jgi:hypothetical protein
MPINDAAAEEISNPDLARGNARADSCVLRSRKIRNVNE